MEMFMKFPFSSDTLKYMKEALFNQQLFNNMNYQVKK
tara:strand:- start:11 stop:121 length:111 start_codon:yes stop_codon:yes gene_type:complete